MNKKILIFILAGVAVAAIVCIITGVVMYSSAISKQISLGSPDYSALLDQKKSAVALGLLMVIVGCTFISLPVAGFIYLLVSYLVAKRRREKKAASDVNEDVAAADSEEETVFQISADKSENHTNSTDNI